MREPNGKLRLSEAREQTPAVNPVEAMRRQLAVSVFGAVKESDVEQMVGKLKEMALAGDHKAMKMYFELIGVMGKQPPPPPPVDANNVKLLAEAIQNVADEIRISKAQADRQANGRLLAYGNGEED